MKNTNTGFGLIGLLVMLVLFVVIAAVGISLYGSLHIAGSGVFSRIESTVKGEATLEGTVTIGPTTPVCRAGSPCTSLVANHTIVAKDIQGNTVATTTTDSNGKYVFHLKPGRYTLVPVPSIGLNMGMPVIVIGGDNHFNLNLDTGIR